VILKDLLTMLQTESIPSMLIWIVEPSSDGKTQNTANATSRYWRGNGRLTTAGWLTLALMLKWICMQPARAVLAGAVCRDGCLFLIPVQEGTLRLLPNLKASTAYIMLRPFFLDGADAFDDKTPTFPGATPGGTQFYPTRQHHPHLDLDRAMIGIPPVKPGDYVFWHADLVHEVDKFHPGTTDSSVSYMACTPLTPYNISSLKSTRESFLQASPPADFGAFLKEEENQHDDHGARKENILSREGMQAMGFEAFDVDGLDLTEGQRAARNLANARLGLV